MAGDLVPSVELLSNLEEIRLSDLEGSVMGLFEGSHVPNIADVLATYTGIETTFGGYTRQTLVGWTPSNMTGLAAYTLGPYAIFTPSITPGAHTVTGYFLIQGTRLIGCGRLAGAITVAPSTPFAVALMESLENG